MGHRVSGNSQKYWKQADQPCRGRQLSKQNSDCNTSWYNTSVTTQPQPFCEMEAMWNRVQLLPHLTHSSCGFSKTGSCEYKESQSPAMKSRSTFCRLATVLFLVSTWSPFRLHVARHFASSAFCPSTSGRRALQCMERDRHLHTGSNLFLNPAIHGEIDSYTQTATTTTTTKNLQYTERQTPIHMQAAKTIPLQAWDWRGNGGSYTRVILIWFHVDRVMLFWFHIDRATLIWIPINHAMLIWINIDPVMLIWFL